MDRILFCLRMNSVSYACPHKDIVALGPSPLLCSKLDSLLSCVGSVLLFVYCWYLLIVNTGSDILYGIRVIVLTVHPSLDLRT
jgi:hypothetical protein